jgi:hypothetical protein
MKSEIAEKQPQLVSPISVLLLLLLFMMVGSAVGSGISYLIGQQMGLTMADLLPVFGEQSPLEARNFIRLANLFSHLFTFTAPAIILAVLLYKKQWFRFFKFDRFPGANMLMMGVLFLFAIFVVSQAALWLNQQLPMPSWASEMESSAARIIKGLLVMDSTGELILTIFVVAALPAVGEELIFRGFLQQKLAVSFQNPVLAIWVSGFIFSAFHLQFAGLIPRFFLGVGLGYLFYWSQSLWLPVIAHFLINATQIAGQYLTEEEVQEEGIIEINWGAVAIAAIMVAGLSYYLYRQYRTKVKPGIHQHTDRNLTQ